MSYNGAVIDTSVLRQRLPRQKLVDLGVGIVYLFGSHAEETAGPLSDTDIGVVFTDSTISRGNTLDVYSKLYDIFTTIFQTENLDVVFLERASLELRFDVIQHGQAIFEIGTDFRDEFEHRTVMLYADFKSTLRNFDHAVLARI